MVFFFFLLPPPPLLVVIMTGVGEGSGINENVARMVESIDGVKLQIDNPSHTPPEKPEKTESAFDVAVRVIGVSETTDCVQSVVHGLDSPDTTPPPAPRKDSVIELVVGVESSSRILKTLKCGTRMVRTLPW